MENWGAGLSLCLQIRWMKYLMTRGLCLKKTIRHDHTVLYDDMHVTCSLFCGLGFNLNFSHGLGLGSLLFWLSFGSERARVPEHVFSHCTFSFFRANLKWINDYSHHSGAREELEFYRTGSRRLHSENSNIHASFALTHFFVRGRLWKTDAFFYKLLWHSCQRCEASSSRIDEDSLPSQLFCR